MRSAAKHPVRWWALWGVLLAAEIGVVAYLWHVDKNPADRISVVAVAMSVVGIVIAAVAAQWTREAVIIADNTLRYQALSEDMHRLDRISDLVRECAASLPGSGERLKKALLPFGEKELPDTFALRDACGDVDPPTPTKDQIEKAALELGNALDARLTNVRSLIKGQ